MYAMPSDAGHVVVNWWIDSKPVTVMAMGDLDFYGRENAEERGVTKF
jgi:hypothetical protein